MGRYPIKWSRKPYGRELSVLHATPIPQYAEDVKNVVDGGRVDELTELAAENIGPATEPQEASSIRESEPAVPSAWSTTPAAMPHPVPPAGTTEPSDQGHSGMMSDLSAAGTGKQGRHPQEAGALQQVVCRPSAERWRGT
ncbi:hypothetical protein OE88DRAFT_1660211 [Heliocybe sulcata]|uniref:Uncharacterized protein n=1 Tax=Heliocybe sulcata TaxID=5364 RepID=A0A5C3N3J6_9AGAM|nr:hypothetical protein OE88DRAFT_1660211 [Heliocybe sulcata]